MPLGQFAKEVGAQSEIVFTSLPVPADVEQVALGTNGLIEGMRPDTALFDMSTNSVAMVRKINAPFAEKNLYMLDSPVTGGAASGKMAIWIGGDEQIFNRHKPVLDAMGDQAAYIGPIGAGPIAKLVHNCTSAVMGVALAEVFTMGIKAGVDPVDGARPLRLRRDLWQRCGTKVTDSQSSYAVSAGSRLSASIFRAGGTAAANVIGRIIGAEEPGQLPETNIDVSWGGVGVSRPAEICLHIGDRAL